MLYPNPLTLFCALLFCLPLAIVVTINNAPITISSANDDGDSVPIPANPSLPNAPFDIKATLEARTEESRIPIDANPPPPGIVDAGDATYSPTPPPGAVSYDDAEDEALFRAAVRVSPKPKRPKKLAFMFMTVTGLPFAPLWETYFNNTPGDLYNIYIHADPTQRPSPHFTGVFSGRVIPSKPSQRNTPTLMSAARRLLSHALLHDPSNSMFALLSPSCVPLRSFNFTYRTLANSSKSLIEILKNEPGKYDRWAARGPDAMLPEVTLEDFRIGSQFWVLTRRHATMATADRRLWSKFKLPCVHRQECYPEEHYFPTLLSMQDPRGCVPCTLTHVDWSVQINGHPRTYQAEEVDPGLIRRLRSMRPRYGDDGANGTDLLARHDPFLFARKFDPSAAGALMGMAEDILFKD